MPPCVSIGSCLLILEPSMTMRVPSSSLCGLVSISTLAIAAIEASASPRNPMELMLNRSFASLILDVACRSKLIRASVAVIPLPLSSTCMRVFPASLMISLISWAPASSEFSMSSFTTEAGRWITSPAAI